MPDASTHPGKLRRTSYRKSIISCLTRTFFIYQTGRCLSHVVNLANVAVMACVTKIAAVENATAIWEYDPNLPDNRVLGGSLDVIAAIRTIAIKVSCVYFKFNHLTCPWVDSSIRPTDRIF